MGFNIWKFGGRYSKGGSNPNSYIGDIFEMFNFAFFWKGNLEKVEHKENEIKINDVVLVSDGQYLRHFALIDIPKFKKVSDFVDDFEKFKKYIEELRKNYTSEQNFILFKDKANEFFNNIGLKLKCVQKLKRPINYKKSGLFFKIPLSKRSESDYNYIIKLRNECLKNEIKQQQMEKYTSLLINSKNLIFHGAPGTGKTYLAKQIAALMVSNGRTFEEKELTKEEKDRIKFVQFHPSYDYTDFVEGLRPGKKGDNEIGFEIKAGIFKEFCEKAMKDQKNYVFIIDEINRADISKVFGELFFSLDPDYRGEKGKVLLQYNNMHKKEADKWFYIPENVYIIGTMNDIDRSVDTFDFAIRRRFTWKELKVDDELINRIFESLDEKFDKEKTKNRLKNLNDAISEIEGLNDSYHIGPAYFLKLSNYLPEEKDKINEEKINDAFDKLWEYHLEPLLREYLRGMPDADCELENLAKTYGIEIKKSKCKEENT